MKKFKCNYRKVGKICLACVIACTVLTGCNDPSGSESRNLLADKIDSTTSKIDKPDSAVKNTKIFLTSKCISMLAIPSSLVAADSRKARAVNPVMINGKVLNGRTVSSGQQVVLNQVVDFGNTKFQSFFYEDGKFYSLQDNVTSPVTVFDTKGKIIDRIYKQATGHNNDILALGNLKYITSGGIKLYVWNTDTNAVSTVQLDMVAQYARDNNTRIDIGGIARSTTNGNILYLVGLDKHATAAIEREKGTNIIVFKHDLTTGRQEFLLRDELNYIGLLQGAVEHNGILYVAQNSKTDNSNLSNYTGITVKAYDTETTAHLDDIQIDGRFEAEGMQVIEREDGSKEVSLGLHGSGAEKVISFVPLEKPKQKQTSISEAPSSVMVADTEKHPRILRRFLKQQSERLFKILKR
ncbi:hypothetical protein [Streptococcus ruminantium]|uniref:hypothetical protein n=1 Tax=Streptococcus ruminantium TaxID=1917441 RepID=UPI0012DD6097|nr:hypothetical protein [Streptococcus ruminantium]